LRQRRSPVIGSPVIGGKTGTAETGGELFAEPA
jgi:hypothetical protein